MPWPVRASVWPEPPDEPAVSRGVWPVSRDVWPAQPARTAQPAWKTELASGQTLQPAHTAAGIRNDAWEERSIAPACHERARAPSGRPASAPASGADSRGTPSDMLGTDRAERAPPAG